MSDCPACGHVNPDDARFCNACGARLEPAEPAGDVRKTVTVLFCDVVGSTELGERFDPEVLQRLMSRFYAAVRGPVERHGGTVEKVIGDALVAVFGIPVLREDDALQAARAALEARDAVRGLGDLQARIGVNTGDVLTRDPSRNETLVIGDAVNVAARLEQAAAPGEVLVGEETWALIRHAAEGEPVAPVRAKGKREPLVAWRLEHVDPAARSHVRRLDLPIVGRVDELDLLRHTLSRTVQTRRPHLVTVLGPPGIGKSRLVAELPRLNGDLAVLVGQCRATTGSSSLQPLLEAARGAVGDVRELMAGDPDAAAVAACLGESAPAGPLDIAWALSRLIGAIAEDAPVAVVLEDVHWADDLLLDVVEQLLRRTRRAALLVVCTARPELADRRPGWGAGPNAMSFTLDRLDDDETRRLLANLSLALPARQAARVVTAAEGNPLFVEHLAALVTGDEETDTLPRSLQVLLAARLEALPPPQREVVGVAAVVGRDFPAGAVAALLGRDIGDELEDLGRRELLEPAGPGTFRFGHALLQEAAYGLIPKQQRSDLHRRLAHWLGDAGADEAIVGDHLERATQLRGELGLLDDETARLREEAGVRLAAAGTRADALGDPRRARMLLERALRLLPEGSAATAGAKVELAAAGWNLLPAAEVMRLLEEAAGLARELGLRALELRAIILRLGGLPDTSPDALSERELLEFTRRALVELDALGDVRAVATALSTRAELELSAGSAARAVDSALAAIEALRSIDQDTVWAVANLVRSLVESSTPVPAAEGLLAGLLEELGTRPTVRSELVQGQAMLAQLAGRTDEAWRLLESARGLEEDLGRRSARHVRITEGSMLLRGGRGGEARAVLGPVIADLERRGALEAAAMVRSRVALAEAQAGIFDDAAAGAAASEDYETRTRDLLVLAERHLAGGATAAAALAAREAVAIADQGDWVLLRIQAHATLHRVLAAAGDAGDEHHRIARELCDAKGIAPTARPPLGIRPAP